MLLETYGFVVFSYTSAAQFLADDRRLTAKCLIIDQHMPNLTGLDVVAALRRERALVPTSLVTGRLETGIAQRAGALGVHAIPEKPFGPSRLVDLIRGALDLQA